MSKKQMYILAAVVAVVIVGIVLALNSGSNLSNSGTESQNSSVGQTSTSTGYSKEVPKNIQISTSDVAVAMSGNPNVQLRVFDQKNGLQMSKSGFSPNQIGINNGDTIRILITATDADYDLSIPRQGMYWPLIKKGETKPVEFTPSETGPYIVECKDHCPASGKISMTIYVK